MELSAENARLKAEVERLRAELEALRTHQSADTPPPPPNLPVVVATNPDGHSAPAKDSVTGLRLKPVFGADGRVEIVAQVVPDLKRKRRKHNHKKHGVHSHSKGKNKRSGKPPKIRAEIDASAIVQPLAPPSEQAGALKRLVKDKVGKFTPIKEVAAAASLEELLEDEVRRKKTGALYVVNLGAVVDKWLEWQHELPGIDPHYAVKSNPDINIVRTLAVLGSHFDCASRAEIEQVLSLGVLPSKIIFANPCKGVDHIRFARERGVALMTFDNEAELDKIQQHYPDARLVLRVLADDSHSLCPFGSKFGASKEDTIKLIARAKHLGLNLVGVSFHVGSSCQAAIAWADALRLVRWALDQAAVQGFKLSLVDMGGGWPGTDAQKLTFPAIAAVLRPVIAELFPPSSGVRVIAEPGRFFCTSSYTLAVTVNSKRERYKAPDTSPAVTPTVPTAAGHPAPPPPPAAPIKETLYYLSDGIYGSFNNIIFDHAVPDPQVMRSPSSQPELAKAGEDSERKGRACLFGPTCDSIDVICKDVDLPDLAIGDWLYFRDMGAYTFASSSSFNGFNPPTAVYYITAAPDKKP